MRAALRDLVLLVSIGLGFAFLIPVSSATAQEMPAPVLAVVDIERIERESLAWKDLTTKLNERRAAFENQIRALQKPLEEEFTALEGQRSILSSDAFAAKQRELNERGRQLQQTAQGRKQELDRAFLTARIQIRNKLRSVLTELMKQRGINLILNSPQLPSGPNALAVTDVVLAHSALDLTALATDRLNAAITTVEFPVAAQ